MRRCGRPGGGPCPRDTPSRAGGAPFLCVFAGNGTAAVRGSAAVLSLPPRSPPIPGSRYRLTAAENTAADH